MKAPDKIYIPMTPDCDVAVNDWSGVPLSQYDGKPVTENICYIRKDALLEWANKRLEEFRHIAEISNDVAADGEVDAFEELIDKLNSM